MSAAFKWINPGQHTQQKKKVRKWTCSCGKVGVNTEFTNPLTAKMDELKRQDTIIKELINVFARLHHFT